MKVKIEIDTQTFVRFWLVVIGLGLLGLFIYSARTALIIIGTALFLALALNKPVASMAKLLPGRSRLGGTSLAFASIVIILGATIWFVVPPLIQQSARFAQNLPALVDQVNGQWIGLSDFIEKNGLEEQVNSALENIKSQSASWAADAGGSVVSGVGSLASFTVSLFLVIVLSFLMLLEGPAWMSRIWKLYSDKDKMAYHKRLTGRIYQVVTGYITGQLTISAIGSLAAGLAVFILSFTFVDIPANLAMPTILIVFLLSLIPMFGATIAGVLVAVLLLMNNLSAAIIYVVFFIVYQQIENNMIAPAIQAKQVELSALIVLLSVTVGIYVGGLIGGVIAIPIAGTVKVLIEEYIDQRKSEQRKQKKGLAQLASRLKS